MFLKMIMLILVVSLAVIVLTNNLAKMPYVGLTVIVLIGVTIVGLSVSKTQTTMINKIEAKALSILD